MKSAKQVEEFVREWFNLFGFDYQEMVGTEEVEVGDDDEIEIVDAPLVVNNELVTENVKRAAEAFGVDSEDLVNMDGDLLRKQLQRFRFFDLIREFEAAYEAAFYEPGYETARLIHAIFQDTPNKLKEYPSRYDYKDVKKRLLALLKQYNKSLPGSYHENATLVDLTYSTCTFCHFKQIDELCLEFLNMVDREEMLFTKALDTDLSPAEISEYNLIASIIGLKDACMPTGYNLYYSTLIKRREVYRNEEIHDFFFLTALSKYHFFHPYRCAEFAENRELVQRFSSLYPRMKTEMREFSRDVSKFRCVFHWSDEDLRAPDDSAIDAFIDGKISGAEVMKTAGWVEVYVPKTEQELDGDMKYAEMLHAHSGPESLGGVKNAKYPQNREFDARRLQARIEADLGR